MWPMFVLPLYKDFKDPEFRAELEGLKSPDIECLRD